MGKTKWKAGQRLNTCREPAKSVSLGKRFRTMGGAGEQAKRVAYAGFLGGRPSGQTQSFIFRQSLRGYVMRSATIIFPHQLFRQHPALSNKKNPRMQVMTHQIDRMGKNRMKEHLAIANHFLERL